MPFYGANTGPLPPQSGGMVDPAGGFAPPLRDRFPNSVWHPASGADPNTVGEYPCDESIHEGWGLSHGKIDRS